MDYSNLRRQAASMKKTLFDQACIILDVDISNQYFIFMLAQGPFSYV
jgi:hypothetical protein